MKIPRRIFTAPTSEVGKSLIILHLGDFSLHNSFGYFSTRFVKSLYSFVPSPLQCHLSNKDGKMLVEEIIVWLSAAWECQ